MRDDLLHTTISSALARLRRAMRFHRVPTTPEGAGGGSPRGQPPAGGSSRSAAQEAGRSLTERQLQVLGVGRPPNGAEAGLPGARW